MPGQLTRTADSNQKSLLILLFCKYTSNFEPIVPRYDKAGEIAFNSLLRFCHDFCQLLNKNTRQNLRISPHLRRSLARHYLYNTPSGLSPLFKSDFTDDKAVPT